MSLSLGILCRNFDNYSNRRFIEAAASKGHTAQLIDYVNCDLSVSHSALNLYYESKSLKKLDAIIPRVSVTSSFYGLAVVRQFQMMGIYTANMAQSIAQSRDSGSSIHLDLNWPPISTMLTLLLSGNYVSISSTT